MFNPFFQKYLGRGLLFFIPGTKDSKRKKKQRVLFLVSERFNCNTCTSKNNYTRVMHHIRLL